MGFLSRLFGREKKANVVTLGTSGAGKTTLIKFLETGKPVLEEPKMTLGLDIRENGINIDGWAIKAIDVGGQDLYQNTLWALGVTQSQGILYLIDGTIKEESKPEKFEESLFSFKYMLSIVSPKKPLLIIINKQDLQEENPYTVEEAIRKYKIDELINRSFNIIGGSAKYGKGLEVGMTWMMDKIEQNQV